MLEEHRIFAEFIASGLSPENAALNAGVHPDAAVSAAHEWVQRDDVQEHIVRAQALASGRAPSPPLPPTRGGKPTKDDTPIIPSCGKNSKLFLETVMGEPRVSLSIRMEAAKLLLPFQHAKIGELGKKEAAQQAAEKAAGKEKYTPTKPPKGHLSAVK